MTQLTSSRAPTPVRSRKLLVSIIGIEGAGHHLLRSTLVPALVAQGAVHDPTFVRAIVELSDSDLEDRETLREARRLRQRIERSARRSLEESDVLIVDVSYPTDLPRNALRRMNPWLLESLMPPGVEHVPIIIKRDVTASLLSAYRRWADGLLQQTQVTLDNIAFIEFIESRYPESLSLRVENVVTDPVRELAPAIADITGEHVDDAARRLETDLDVRGSIRSHHDQHDILPSAAEEVAARLPGDLGFDGGVERSPLRRAVQEAKFLVGRRPVVWTRKSRRRTHP